MVYFGRWYREKIHQEGFTLIEVLLAIFISAFLVSSAAFGLVYISRQNRIAEAKSVRRVELNRALDYIAELVREAVLVTNSDDKETIILTMPNGDQIEFYYADVANNSVWSGPGVIYRVENGGTPVVLVDGIAKQGFELPSCNSDEEILVGKVDGQNPAGGLFTCIDNTFRTASLTLYGRLNVENKTAYTENDFLIVSSKFVARNAPVGGQCVVPAVSSGTLTADEAKAAWINAGFKGDNFNPINDVGNLITIQDLTPQSFVDCDTSVLTVGDNSDKCTVPDYINGTIDAAFDAWNSSSFTGNFSAEAFGLAEGESPDGNSLIVGAQATSPVDKDPGEIIICSSSITVSEQKCTVPGLVGLSNTDAQSEWNGNNNSLFTTTLIPDALDTNNFTVEFQSIEPGTQSFCSAEMTVGERKCLIPDFSGYDSGDPAANNYYINEWTRLGFDEDKITLAVDNPNTTILSGQSVPAGTETYCKHAEITVYESSTCSIPSNSLDGIFINQTVADATTTWQTYGFYPNTVVSYGDGLISRYVIDGLSTAPLDGNGNYQLDCGTVVNVYDSTYCRVPNLLRDNLNQATSAWTNAGFNANNILTTGFTNTNSQKVEAQSLAAGTFELCTSTQVLLTGDACVVPDMIGLQRPQAASAWVDAGFSSSNFTSYWSNSNNQATSSSTLSSAWTTSVFDQTPAQGQILSCSNTSAKVYSESPYNVRIASRSSVKQGSKWRYTVNLAWDFPKTAGLSEAASFRVFTCSINLANSSDTTTCSPQINENSVQSITDNAIVFSGNNPVVTGKTVTHEFTDSVGNGLKRSCYSVLARNNDADAFSPETAVPASSGSAPQCFIHDGGL